MKLLLAAVTAAATLATVGGASAQPTHGYGSAYRQSYGPSYAQAANGWRGSSYTQSNWGRRDLTGYTAAHGAYNRGGYAGYGVGWRDRDDFGAGTRPTGRWDRRSMPTLALATPPPPSARFVRTGDELQRGCAGPREGAEARLRRSLTLATAVGGFLRC